MYIANILSVQLFFFFTSSHVKIVTATGARVIRNNITLSLITCIGKQKEHKRRVEFIQSQSKKYWFFFLNYNEANYLVTCIMTYIHNNTSQNHDLPLFYNIVCHLSHVKSFYSSSMLYYTYSKYHLKVNV